MINITPHNQQIARWSLLALLVIACLAFVGVSGTSVVAAPTQSDLPDSCNVDFMTQMTNRATAEAARDTAMAQTAIRKADSVLEYSCFSQFADLASSEAAVLFTENEHWKGKDIDISSMDEHHSPEVFNINVVAYQPSGTVADAIQDIVLDALESYIPDNFGHDYLAIPGTTVSEGGGAGYDCAVMQVVWHVSKCDPFLSEDLFTTLEGTTDIRKHPQACNNKKQVDLGPQSPSDPIVTQLQRLHRNAPNVSGCSKQTPIETGRMVQKIISFSKSGGSRGSRESLDEAEKICLLPGCYYDYTTKKCAE